MLVQPYVRQDNKALPYWKVVDIANKLVVRSIFSG